LFEAIFPAFAFIFFDAALRKKNALGERMPQTPIQGATAAFRIALNA